MHTSTTIRRGLLLTLLMFVFAGSAVAQRTVTLTLNAASIPDTIKTDSFFEVRGAVDTNDDGNFESPYTFTDGNVIDWNADSTIEPENIGGDYWQVQFEMATDLDLQFKFFSAQGDAADGFDGWEADPNPIIEAGDDDVVMPVHFFEDQGTYRDFPAQDKGEYDWRPYEQKEDSVAVWYRVWMNTNSAIGAGYDQSNPPEIAVRGDGLDGDSQLDWGANNVLLQRERDEVAQPGYHLFSGVAYYPESAAGKVQPYKFIVGATGWEGSISDRTFTVPAQDSTLYWVTFDDGEPLQAQPVDAALTFSVDVSPIEEVGIFSNIRGDTLQVRGEFNGWDCSPATTDVCVLDEQAFVPNQPWEREIALSMVPPRNLPYKYFIDFEVEQMQQDFGADVVPSGWEEPYGTQGANRFVEFDGNDKTVAQVYNDMLPANVIPAGNSVDVHFTVDMTPAITADEPFDPASDSVTVYFRDPIWAFTQGMPLSPRGDDPNRGDGTDVLQTMRDILQLTDPDGDSVYEGSLTVSGPTFNGIQYWYAYGQGTTFSNEPGAGLETGGGARRVRFIVPNTDGSWPDEWDIGAETYIPDGPLPFDPNPAINIGVEPVDGEVPARVTLGDNYPNPFNPTTSFEYTLDRTIDVSVAVFDVLGRRVATLVDGTQQASTYKVTFDASNLASGTYIYRLETPNQVVTKTMVLLK